jgi:DNA polymerase I-like protein with 3'-5' exonuclease and polymerase domains
MYTHIIHTSRSKQLAALPMILYTRAKSAVFAMMYGGTEHTLVERLGVPLDVASAALARFHKEFPGVKRAQQRITNMLSALQQVGGIGSKIEYKQACGLH